MFAPQIDLAEEFIIGIEEIAKQHGFATVDDYLKIVIEAHVMAAKVASQVLKEDGVDIRQDLEQAFYEAFTGQTVPLESLWDDDDTEPEND